MKPPSLADTLGGITLKKKGNVAAALLLSVGLLFGLVQPAQAEALISIRQTILTQQRDRILISFEASIGPIGNVHSLSSDCDIHVPLITTALFLPVLGEIKNACSMGPTKAQLIALGPGPVTVEGAFRIWFEGHDEGIPFREEDRGIPESYEDSGPPHLVEVHPITRLGSLDLLDRVRFIEKDGQTIGWKTGQSFRRAVRSRLMIRRRTIEGRRYVVMRCACAALANHYRLEVEILYPPHTTVNGDGTVASGRIIGDEGEVLLPLARLFAIRDTPAGDALEGVEAGDRLTVYGLAWLSLRPLLNRVTSTERMINLPIELVLLRLEPQ